MGRLYALFIPFQLLSLVYIHITASDIVGYGNKLKKKNPSYAPQNLWDYLSLNYLLRCPKANRSVKTLYYINLANIVLLGAVVAISIIFWTNFDGVLPIIVHFWPIGVFVGNFVFCNCIGAYKTDIKYVLRYWLLPDLAAFLLAVLSWALLK